MPDQPRDTHANVIAGAVLQDLADHLDDIDKYAPAAVRRYIKALMAGKSGSPHTRELNPHADALLRDLVNEHMTLDRRARTRAA